MQICQSAKYTETCSMCHQTIEVGTPVARIRRAYPWIHASCALELEQMRMAGLNRRAALRRIRS